MVVKGAPVRIAICGLLGFSQLLLAANVGHAAAAAEASKSPALAAQSRAVDWNFTQDSIDIEVRPVEGGVFRLATRPGENVFITKFIDRNTVKRMAFIVMPEPPDGDLDTITRDEILDVPKNELTFFVTPICFNSKTVPNPPPGRTKDASDCKSRPWNDGSESNVVPFSSLKTRGVRLGDEFHDQILGMSVKLLDYSTEVDVGDKEANPVAKCCVEGLAAEVCAGAVSYEGKWCRLGTSIRVAAK